MLRFVRPLLIASLLSLPTAASAQDLRYGSPQSLQGRYSTALEQCVPDHYQYGLLKPSRYFRHFAPAADGYVKSHRATATGFILNLVSRDCTIKWTENITVIDDKTIRVEGAGSKTLLLCPDDPPWNVTPLAGAPCPE